MGGPTSSNHVGCHHKHATTSTYHPLSMHDNGWTVLEGALAIDWDDPDKIKQVECKPLVTYIGVESVSLVTQVWRV